MDVLLYKTTQEFPVVRMNSLSLVSTN